MRAAVTRLTIAQARRIALAAQGFADKRPPGRVDVRAFRRVVARTGLVQLDSVNVLTRAHYLPFFSRLGPYDRAALDRWLWRSGEMFEYWGHEASVMPLACRPLVAHRMEGGWHWPGVERAAQERPELVAALLAEVEARGPVRISELDHDEPRAGSWWGWSDAKRVVEYLFLTGRVTVSNRPNFAKVYDLPRRVHGDAVVDTPAVPAHEARTALLELGARAHGVGTVTDLADYYRIPIKHARAAVPGLVEAGVLEPVEVQGWKEPAYLHAEAARPRRISGRALLVPFDPVVWFRPRGERLFDFHYRIEIYTPAAKRVFGYYVLPFLLDDGLVGRVDLKADRAAGRLMVRGAFLEPGHDPARVTVELHTALVELAEWLDLGGLDVGTAGELATPLRRL